MADYVFFEPGSFGGQDLYAELLRGSWKHAPATAPQVVVIDPATGQTVEPWGFRHPLARTIRPATVGTASDLKTQLDLVRAFLFESSAEMANIPLRRLVPICLYVDDMPSPQQISRVLSGFLERAELEPLIQFPPLYGSFFARLFGVSKEAETQADVDKRIQEAFERGQLQGIKLGRKSKGASGTDVSKEVRQWVGMIGLALLLGGPPAPNPQGDVPEPAPTVCQTQPENLRTTLPKLFLSEDPDQVKELLDELSKSATTPRRSKSQTRPR